MRHRRIRPDGDPMARYRRIVAANVATEARPALARPSRDRSTRTWLAVDVHLNFTIPKILSLRNVYFPIMPRPDGVPFDSADPSADPLPHAHYFALFVDSPSSPVREPDNIPVVFERVSLFCAVWAFGGLLDDTARSASDCFLCDRTDLRGSKTVFSQRRTVFDFFASFDSSCRPPKRSPHFFRQGFLSPLTPERCESALRRRKCCFFTCSATT
jgi:hypothetical protein